MSTLGRISKGLGDFLRDLAVPVVSIVAVISSVSIADSTTRAARSQSDHEFVRTQQLTAYTAFLNAFGAFTSDVDQAATYRQILGKPSKGQFLAWDQASLKASGAIFNAMPPIELVGSNGAYEAAFAISGFADSETGKLQDLLGGGTSADASRFLADFDKQAALVLAKFKLAARADVNSP